MSTWIELNRLLLPAEEKREESPSLAALLYVPGTAFTWAEVLPSPCVVLLGEAGSGKTSELRAQAERLGQEGHAAFFVRVEELAKDGVRSAVEGDRERLDSWKRGSAEGWLFLDAVDEAKLRAESLRRAITKLTEELSDALSRCHVVVSCRHSDWREEDAAELRRLVRRLIQTKVPPLPGGGPRAARPPSAAAVR